MCLRHLCFWVPRSELASDFEAGDTSPVCLGRGSSSEGAFATILGTSMCETPPKVAVSTSLKPTPPSPSTPSPSTPPGPISSSPCNAFETPSQCERAASCKWSWRKQKCKDADDESMPADDESMPPPPPSPSPPPPLANTTLTCKELDTKQACNSAASCKWSWRKQKCKDADDESMQPP